MVRLGQEIKRLRLERGYTQQQLGEMLGVQKSAVQKYEKGTVKNLKQETMIRLCQIFDVSPAVFMDAMYDTDKLSREVKLLDEMSMMFGSMSVELMELYQSLNEQGKAKLYGYAKDLAELGKYTIE